MIANYFDSATLSVNSAYGESHAHVDRNVFRAKPVGPGFEIVDGRFRAKIVMRPLVFVEGDKSQVTLVRNYFDGATTATSEGGRIVQRE